jgi:recA bacterial DNA recombination protein
MSSLLVCAQPATSCSDVFVSGQSSAALLSRFSTMPQLSRVSPASRLEVRPAPETLSSGIPEIDTLTGGWPRGCLSEIYGPASSGRTGLLLTTLAAVTRRQEACVLVDVNDAFDPQSAAAAGVDFKNLLWVRCDSDTRSEKKKNLPRRHQDTEGSNSASGKNFKNQFARLAQALRTTDLLLQSGGFGLVAIDLTDVPWQAARRIPLTSWFRFRRAVENTPTVLLVIGQAPCARTCASVLLQLKAEGHGLSPAQQTPENFPAFAPAAPPHTQLLCGLSIRSELTRSRLDRKPVQSVVATFETKTAWGTFGNS